MNVVALDGKLIGTLECPKPAKPWLTWRDVVAGLTVALLVAMVTLV